MFKTITYNTNNSKILHKTIGINLLLLKNSIYLDINNNLAKL